MDIRQSIESSREAHCDYKEICQYQKKGFEGYRNPNISSAVWFEPTPLKDRKETPL